MRQIRFFQLKKGQKFTYQGNQYTRIKDIRKSCCIVLFNARLESTQENVKLPPNIIVEIE